MVAVRLPVAPSSKVAAAPVAVPCKPKVAARAAWGGGLRGPAPAPQRLPRAPQLLHVVRAGGGSGVLDNPTTLPGNAPKKQAKNKRPPSYRVMLHNDAHNRREYVVRVLLKVVKGITADDAATAMQVAHESGVALVTQCPQEEAEHYCQGLRINGLTSTIEPGC